MNRKKMLPLVLLAAGAVLLGVLLAVLTSRMRRRKIPASRWWTLPPRMWTSWPTPATMWM